jgi:rhodanese-related sulfurtransferase
MTSYIHSLNKLTATFLALLCVYALANSRILSFRYSVPKKDGLNKSVLQEIGLPDLMRLQHTKGLVLMDLRPLDLYKAAHIPGAIYMSSMPSAMNDNKAIAAIGSATNLVAYGINKTDVEVFAASLQNTNTNSVKYYHEGIAEWVSCGLPISRD